LPKNLFAEFLFAEKYCLDFDENFICGIADLPIYYLPKSNTMKTMKNRK
jgi:hypothetical protein